MAVARANGDCDAGLKQRLGWLRLTQSRKQLCELKVAGYVIRMVFEQFLEVLLCDLELAVGRAAHRQAISQKWIVRLGGQKLFELFAS